MQSLRTKNGSNSETCIFLLLQEVRCKLHNLVRVVALDELARGVRAAVPRHNFKVGQVELSATLHVEEAHVGSFHERVAPPRPQVCYCFWQHQAVRVGHVANIELLEVGELCQVACGVAAVADQQTPDALLCSVRHAVKVRKPVDFDVDAVIPSHLEGRQFGLADVARVRNAVDVRGAPGKRAVVAAQQEQVFGVHLLEEVVAHPVAEGYLQPSELLSWQCVLELELGHARRGRHGSRQLVRFRRNGKVLPVIEDVVRARAERRPERPHPAVGLDVPVPPARHVAVVPQDGAPHLFAGPQERPLVVLSETGEQLVPPKVGRPVEELFKVRHVLLVASLHGIFFWGFVFLK